MTQDTSFIDRMKTELDELDAKILKLENFFEAEIFKSLPEIEQSLLHIQHNAMSGYAHALETRSKLALAKLDL